MSWVSGFSDHKSLKYLFDGFEYETEKMIEIY